MASRRLLGGRMTMISLCKRGINRMPVIAKAADGLTQFESLVKASEKFDETGEVTAVVYPPNHSDYEGDIADAEAIRKMQRESTREGFGIDIKHNNVALPKSAAWIAENFIVAKGDARFQDWKDYEGNAVDLTGAWAVVVKVEDANLRAKYKSGEWNGVSMFGDAMAQPIGKSSETQTVEKFIRDLSEYIHRPESAAATTEDDMTPEQIAALSKGIGDAVVAGLTPVLKGTPAPAAAAPAAAPVEKAEEIKFVGDPTDEVAVAKHLERVELAALRKGVDFSDAAQVTAYSAKLKEHKEKVAKAAPAPAAETPEVIRLKAELAKAQGASAQAPAAPAAGTTPALPSGIAKADIDAGNRIAKLANERRGFAQPAGAGR